MKDKYCRQLEGLPKNDRDIHRDDLFMCRITGNMCIASTYEDPDPGHPASLGFEAHYDDAHAKRECPAYNIEDELAKKLRLSRLEQAKFEIESKIKEELK